MCVTCSHSQVDADSDLDSGEQSRECRACLGDALVLSDTRRQQMELDQGQWRQTEIRRAWHEARAKRRFVET
jgi:hypothetical protein